MNCTTAKSVKKKPFRKDSPQNPIFIHRPDSFTDSLFTGVMVRDVPYNDEFTKPGKVKLDIYIPNRAGVSKEEVLDISNKMKRNSRQRTGEMVCCVCRRVFTPLRSDAKTCSGKCRTALSRMQRNPDKFSRHMDLLNKRINEKIRES
jgi:predicted nucleic acid-binding Zn ribbon protein